MDKWTKRDKKLKARQAFKTFNKQMTDNEPRKRKHRYKSRADIEWEFNGVSEFDVEDV